MRLTWEELQARNEEHLIRPKPGDMWEEHLVVCFLVIWTDGEFVEYLDSDHKKDFDDHHWVWDFSKPAHRQSIADFAKRLRYGSIPGTWATVHPGSRPHAGAVLAALEVRKKRAP